MNEMLRNVGKNLTRMKGKAMATLSAYSPEILTGLGIAGLIGTVALTARAAIRIDHILKDAEEAKGEKLTPKEIVKETWKEAAPVVLSTAATGACIFASHQVSSNRKAAIMAAYALAEDKLGAYKDAAAKIFTEDEQQELNREADQSLVDNVPDLDVATIFETGQGDTLCMDIMTGRLFHSSMESIRRAQNDVNEQIISDWSAILNDFYNALGLDNVKLGDGLGWNSNNLLRVRFDSVLSKGGVPVLVVDYDVYPEYQLL